MTSLLSFRTWLVLSLVWVAAIVYWCFYSWPHLPMDVSAIDPETLQIFEDVKRSHLWWHVAAAVVPPAVAYIVGRAVCAMTAHRSGA